jgi:uncharacterized protein (TIGR02996 family)
MTDDAATFLRAILADPDADGPRLAYADWLDETGDPARAEFIRTQCALAALPAGEREFHSLRERERALLDQHREEWLRPVYDLFRGAGPRPGGWRRWFRPSDAVPVWGTEFRRGFVEWLAVDPVAFVRHAVDLLRVTPLRCLSLNVSEVADGPAVLAAVIACPQLAAMRELALITHPLRLHEVRRLTGCLSLTGLRDLFLECDGLDRASVQALADADWLSRLETLGVMTSDPGNVPWAEALLEAPASRGLVELFISSREPATDLLTRLGRSPPFIRLVALSLHDLQIGDSDLDEFLTWLPSTLTRLSLSTTRLGDLAAVSLARSPRIRQLRRLDLSQNRITDTGALTLADSPHLLAPTRLDLSGNPISERVRNALRVRLGHQVVV